MSKKNSTASSNSGSNDTTKQAASFSKGTLQHRHTHVKMLQNSLLVWLDINIDTNTKDHQTAVTQLLQVVHDINIFTDSNQCIRFMEGLNDDKAYMIISGSLGQYIVPKVHDISQLDAIFIFCSDKKRHEQWAKQWPKIRGVFTEISSICEALKQIGQQTEQNAVAISFMAINENVVHQDLDQLDASFIYTQILKEILLTIKFEQQHIKEFIHYCREEFAQNDHELSNITKIEREYYQKTPVWWYTYECFLHPMLNHALRIMDVNTIIKMGFFIADLHRHIKQLHSEQFGGHHSDKTFTVYRGQVMSKEGFGQLRKRQGGLMSFNNFLSTSKDRQISLQFAYQAVENPDLVGVLFIMTIDPSQSTVPFAATTDVSYNNKADEVLFSMHTVFRIHNIKPLDKNNHLFEVNLALTNDTDQDLCVLANRIREETSASTNGWYRLSQLLLEMGKIDEAQQINNALLKQTTNDTENGDNYEQLGRGKYHQGDYKEALKFYEKALELRQKTLPSNHPNLASSYFNIGLVYFNTGEYLKALSYHEKVLEIRQQSLHPSHPDLASSYNNIGLVYFNMANYSKALSYHEKALEIQQKGLPPNHPDLASSYNNIGLVYFNVSDYSKALSYHEKALEIRQQSLPPGHPQIVSSYKKIGLVYEKMEEYPKALSYYDKVLQMQQKVLPPNHPDLAASCNNIGCIYAKMNEYSKSLFYYERAVEIGQHSLPSNHPDFEEYRKNLDQVKKKL